MTSPAGLAVTYLCLVAATPFMIVPWLIFIGVPLITYTGFLKLTARILSYSVSWKSGFHFAGIMLIIVILGHVLTFSESLTVRIGHNVVLLLGLVVLGGWFFSERGTNRRGAILFPPASSGRTPPTAFDMSCRQDLQFWLEQIT